MTTSSEKDTEKFLRVYARLGLVAYGIVYTLMSTLAFLSAIGYTRRKSGQAAAFNLIHEQPFGKVLLFIMGVCMIGYVILRFFQAFKDTRHKGSGLRGIAVRCAYMAIALTYLALSYYCFKLALNKPDNGNYQADLVGSILLNDYGTLIVTGISAGFLAAAIYQIWRGVSRNFMKQVDLYHTEFKTTFMTIGMIGFVARGIVFAVISWLFCKAALKGGSNKTEGTDGAFNFVRENFGSWIMAVMALGFLAYALFLFVRAKHERMNFDIGKSAKK
jgi:hypothetical protein